MNNLACKGLLFTQSAFEKNRENRDLSGSDPESLVKSFDKDTWNEVDSEKKSIEDSDTGVASCRAWYDANDYGKPYCCQMVTKNDTWRKPYIVDATSTDEAKAFDHEYTTNGVIPSTDSYKMEALTFDGAQVLASGIAVLASALAFMN